MEKKNPDSPNSHDGALSERDTLDDDVLPRRASNAEPDYSVPELEEQRAREERNTTASSYNRMAQLFGDQGSYKEALEFHQKALRLQKRLFGPIDLHVADTDICIGMIFEKEKDYDRALNFYETACEIKRHCLGVDHPDIAVLYDHMARVLEEQDEHELALDYLSMAKELRATPLRAQSFDSSRSSIADVAKALPVNRESGPAPASREPVTWSDILGFDDTVVPLHDMWVLGAIFVGLMAYFA